MRCWLHINRTVLLVHHFALNSTNSTIVKGSLGFLTVQKYRFRYLVSKQLFNKVFTSSMKSGSELQPQIHLQTPAFVLFSLRLPVPRPYYALFGIFFGFVEKKHVIASLVPHPHLLHVLSLLIYSLDMYSQFMFL